MNLTDTLLAFILAGLAGLSMALQGSMNSALGKTIGQLEATAVVHLIGTVTAAGLLLLGLGKGDLARYADAPPYTYLGGVLSVVIIYLVVASIPRVGVAPATTAIIVGQVLTAALIDHLGLFGLKRISFSYLKLLGIALLAAGAWFLLSED